MTRTTGWIWIITWAAIACAASAARGAERKTYDLRHRPAVGQRWAYEHSSDSTITVEGGVNAANVRMREREVRHSQLIVKSDETLEVTAGLCTAKRITFGKGCFSFERANDEPRRDRRLVYSDKTVTFRVLPGGQVEQDFGVKANGRDERELRDAILGRATIFANHPVAVGDRWRADEAMRELMHLKSSDTFSTIFTLKAVREQDGRQVADIGVTAAVLMNERGRHVEMGIEGTYVIDVETGVPIKVDLLGHLNIAGHGRPGMTASGTGTFEFHRAARMLPPTPPQTADAN